MANYWLTIGSLKNWETAFEHGNIWGLKETQRHLWESLSEGDTLFFYATQPVGGIIGYGIVRTKLKQNIPLWDEEIKQNIVIWPLRFEFDVEKCLPHDEWEANRVVNDRIKQLARSGFQLLSADVVRQLVLSMKSIPKLEYVYKVEVAADQTVAEEPPKYVETPVEPPVVKVNLHDLLQQKLVELGRLQGYIAEPEYTIDSERLDVVWRRVERSVPTYVFEVQVGGDVYHALGKLKHAFDLWNSHIFIVATHDDRSKVDKLLAGTFHEINERIKYLELDKIEELYKRKKAYFDLERELGIK